MKQILMKAFVSAMAIMTIGNSAVPLIANAQESELVREHKFTYNQDPTTLDYTATWRQTNSDHTGNFIEPLYENDQYGNYVPAAAESHTVSEDGLVYTYKIRKGIKWVDMNGNEWGETTAHDFVTGLKHAADVKSEMITIVQDSIKGLNEYLNGEITDFNEVGVKAVDDYTLEYTLTKPEPFFNSKTTFGVLYPINQEFLDSIGEDFGALSPDSILYNGPFLLTNFTSKSLIEYTKNPTYWDEKNVNLDTITITYNDGSDLEVFFRLFNDGAISGFTFNPTLPIYKDIKAKYEDNITQGQLQGGTGSLQFNLNRKKHEATAKKDEKQFTDTDKAINNKKFRQAIMFGFDRATWMSQTMGEDFKNSKIRNGFLPEDFVTINGENYGTVLQAKLQEQYPDNFKDINIATGQDGFFNPEKAKELLAEARKELEADGVTFPIHLDLPVLEINQELVMQSKSLKSSIEESLGKDNIIIDLNLLNEDKYLAATFNATVAAETDYDISTENIWTPDFLDPSATLDIYDPEKGAYLIPIGFDPLITKDQEDIDADKRKATGLYDYKALLDEADAIIDNYDARYEKYAEAEAWLLDSAIAIPIYASFGFLRVNKIVPFSGPYALAGPGAARFKYFKVQKDPVTKEQWQKAYDEWIVKKQDSAKKSAEELRNSLKGKENSEAEGDKEETKAEETKAEETKAE